MVSSDSSFCQGWMSLCRVVLLIDPPYQITPWTQVWMLLSMPLYVSKNIPGEFEVLIETYSDEPRIDWNTCYVGLLTFISCAGMSHSVPIDITSFPCPLVWGQYCTHSRPPMHIHSDITVFFVLKTLWASIPTDPFSIVHTTARPLSLMRSPLQLGYDKERLHHKDIQDNVW